jgi:lipopolysaccharide/colanic/teichoic acid biosynthesis glycosyltransferase
MLNVAAAVVGIVIVSPLMVCIAALVKLTSGGPVLYTQTRVGLDRRARYPASENRRRHLDRGGKPFKIYKFRTMRANRGDPERQVWARPDDPRVTGVGRVLRKYRLDELPQLFNVLLGDMNIVGPRPEQPKIFAELRQQIDGYEARQRVRPGITGWAQVNNSYDTSIDCVRTKVAYDLEYISRQSLLEDARILFRTIPVVMFQRGAW